MKTMFLPLAFSLLVPVFAFSSPDDLSGTFKLTIGKGDSATEAVLVLTGSAPKAGSLTVPGASTAPITNIERWGPAISFRTKVQLPGLEIQDAAIDGVISPSKGPGGKRFRGDIRGMSFPARSMTGLELKPSIDCATGINGGSIYLVRQQIGENRFEG